MMRLSEHTDKSLGSVKYKYTILEVEHNIFYCTSSSIYLTTPFCALHRWQPHLSCWPYLRWRVWCLQ
jgi:hypothetical protein